MPHHKPQPVIPYHLIHGNNAKVDHAHARVDLKESRINTLETDKALKDTKIAALETDKSEKDTKMSTMESDMTALTNRVTALETLGIKGISNAVNWTNLTEINLSGEKLTNGDFGDLTKTYFTGTPTIGMKVEILREALTNNFNWASQSKNPFIVTSVSSTGINVEASDGTSGFLENQHRAGANSNPFWQTFTYELNNWTVLNGSLNQTKLAQGIIKGSGGQVAVQQTFSQNIASGTKLIVKVTSDDDIKVTPIKGNGQSDLNNDFTVLGSDSYVEYTTQTNTSGFKVSTVTGLREFSSVSIFQGAISGGTVQAYAGGGLEKISGTGGWNAGASSVQKIEGNSDGYVQFQWVAKSARVGLKYSDTDFNVDSPFLHINFATNTVGSKSVSPGDWFRIRHYASTNEIKYQRKETVYSQNPNFVFETATDSNYSYPSASRPKVISLDGTGTLTIGELYEVYTVRAGDTQALYLRDLDGNAHGYHGQGTRGVRFEVVEEAGQDYVTFYTEPTLTNGNDLYVDVSLYHVGARINDITIVT